MINTCTHIQKEFKDTQIKALEVAIERNRYYLGQATKHYVSPEMAMEDFFKNHLQQYWAKIFKALYCRYKCEDNQRCAIGKRYTNLAEVFKKDVKEFGINKILSGGDATEAVFTRYRRMADNS